MFGSDVDGNGTWTSDEAAGMDHVLEDASYAAEAMST